MRISKSAGAALRAIFRCGCLIRLSNSPCFAAPLSPLDEESLPRERYDHNVIAELDRLGAIVHVRRVVETTSQLVSYVLLANDASIRGVQPLSSLQRRSPIVLTVDQDAVAACSDDAPPPTDVDALALRIQDVMTARRWNTQWDGRLAYHALECAELVEAARGKRGDPLEEAGNVMMTVLALLNACGVLPSVALARASDQIERLADMPAYDGEHRG